MAGEPSDTELVPSVPGLEMLRSTWYRDKVRAPHLDLIGQVYADPALMPTSPSGPSTFLALKKRNNNPNISATVTFKSGQGR